MKSGLDRVMIAGSSIAIFWAVSMLLGSATSVGVSIDEHRHILDFRGWGWAADPGIYVFGVYGTAAQQFNHLITVAFGAESLDSVSFSSQAFAARHIATAFLGIIAAVAVGSITSLVTRNSLVGLWSVAATLTIQPLLGHSGFNSKDVPVATGYTLFTLACVLFLGRLGEGKTKSWNLVWLALTSIFGFWIAAGTRFLFGFVLLATFGLVSLFFIVFGRIQGLSRRFLMNSWLLWLAFVGLGVGLLVLTNPCITSRPSNCAYPFEVFERVLSRSVGIEFSAPTLVAGSFESPIDPAFWLLPLVLLAGLPVFLVLLASLAVVFAPENLRLGHAGELRPAGLERWKLAYLIAVVALQACLVPLATIFTRQEVFDMQRHHLYTYPAIAALAGIGFCLVLNAKVLRGASLTIYRYVVGTVGVALLFIPLYEGLRLWPYNYVYVNPIASIRGIEGQWETDYWAVSLREALDYVPVDQPFSAVGPYWAVKPFMADRGSSPQTLRAQVGEVHVIEAYRPGLGWNGLPKECRDIVKIERNLRGHKVPIAQTGICPRSLGLGASYLEILAHDP